MPPADQTPVKGNWRKPDWTGRASVGEADLIKRWAHREIWNKCCPAEDSHVGQKWQDPRTPTMLTGELGAAPERQDRLRS